MEVEDFKRKVIEISKGISYFGQHMKKKSDSNLELIADNCAEKNIIRAGITIVNLLQQFTSNVLPILNSLEEDIQQVNKNEQDILYRKLSSKISQCKASIALTLNNNIPTKNDKEIEGKSTENITSDEDEPVSLPSTSMDNSPTKRKLNLSLRKERRSHNSDTDDAWNDTLKRTSFNDGGLKKEEKKEQAIKINNSTKSLDEDTSIIDVNADDICDKTTVDLNLSPRDDEFVDGYSPSLRNCSLDTIPVRDLKIESALPIDDGSLSQEVKVEHNPLPDEDKDEIRENNMKQFSQEIDGISTAEIDEILAEIDSSEDQAPNTTEDHAVDNSDQINSTSCKNNLRILADSTFLENEDDGDSSDSDKTQKIDFGSCAENSEEELLDVTNDINDMQNVTENNSLEGDENEDSLDSNKTQKIEFDSSDSERTQKIDSSSFSEDSTEEHAPEEMNDNPEANNDKVPNATSCENPHTVTSSNSPENVNIDDNSDSGNDCGEDYDPTQKISQSSEDSIDKQIHEDHTTNTTDQINNEKLLDEKARQSTVSPGNKNVDGSDLNETRASNHSGSDSDETQKINRISENSMEKDTNNDKTVLSGNKTTKDALQIDKIDQTNSDSEKTDNSFNEECDSDHTYCIPSNRSVENEDKIDESSSSARNANVDENDEGDDVFLDVQQNKNLNSNKTLNDQTSKELDPEILSEEPENEKIQRDNCQNKQQNESNNDKNKSEISRHETLQVEEKNNMDKQQIEEFDSQQTEDYSDNTQRDFEEIQKDKPENNLESTTLSRESNLSQNYDSDQTVIGRDEYTVNDFNSALTKTANKANSPDNFNLSQSHCGSLSEFETLEKDLYLSSQSSSVSCSRQLDMDSNISIQSDTMSYVFDVSDIKQLDNIQEDAGHSKKPEDEIVVNLNNTNENLEPQVACPKNFKNIGNHDETLFKKQLNADPILSPLSRDTDMEESMCYLSKSQVISLAEQEGTSDEQHIPPESQSDKSDIDVSKRTEGGAEEKTSDELGDELLALLKEVTVTEKQVVKKVAKEQDTSDEDKANEILKIWEKEDKDADEISDSDSVSDIENYLSEEEEESDDDDEVSVSKNKYNDILDQFSIKQCYIHLERIKIDESLLNRYDSSDSDSNDRNYDSDDRLCDLRSLIHPKRKHSTESSEINVLHKKYKKRRKISTTENETNSEKDDDDDDDLVIYGSSTSGNNTDLDKILNAALAKYDEEEELNDTVKCDEEKLAELACDEIDMSCKSDSSDSDSQDDSKNKKSKSKNDNKPDGGTDVTVTDNEDKNDNRSEQTKLTEEELKKKAWKNNPLLKGKLTSDSESDSDSNKSKKVKKRKKKNMDEPKRTEQSRTDSSTDSDNQNKVEKNKQTLEVIEISPIKRNIPIESSDSDSDIEFISPKKKTPDKEDEFSSSQKTGRRNIRAVVSDEFLTEATQKANKEEQERSKRLEERHKLFDSLSLSQGFLEDNEEETLVLDINDAGEPLVKVHPKLVERLKPHQKEGIKFMWDSCYESIERVKENKGSGCILAHCMGLGKTLQVITLIHTLFTHRATETRHVLVVCPLSTVNNWRKEVKLAFQNIPNEKFDIYTIGSRKESSQKHDITSKWYLKKRCVLIVGYEGYESLTNYTKLAKLNRNLSNRMVEALIDPGPDLVICDEGHKLKNKSAQNTLALDKMKTKRRIVLTGTPLQNNLLEYYYMINFVKPNLLGNVKEYKTNFVNPITNGQYDDSTIEDIRLMKARTHVLHKVLGKTIHRVEDTELKNYLPKMFDHAVFIQLHQTQVDLYMKYLRLAQEICANVTNCKFRNSFLSDFRVLQLICTHPYLLALNEKEKKKPRSERDVVSDEEQNNTTYLSDGWWKSMIPKDADEKIFYGTKLVVLKSIIEECETIGDKILVFSQSLAELDLIEHFLKKIGTSKCASWKKSVDYLRMDGTVATEDRVLICDKFNDTNNKNIKVLLMSTKVGGLGLNLTAANRVIIMTVNWNPSCDTQSVFRAYRFGQKKEVFVYRLISSGTMEEKVYQRSITKLAIAHRVVDKHQITRHYKSMDLQALYSSEPNADEERPTPNVPEDKMLANVILELPFIFQYHEHQTLLKNRPEDNLNDAELSAAWEEFQVQRNQQKELLQQQQQMRENQQKQLQYQQQQQRLLQQQKQATVNQQVVGSNTIPIQNLASASSVTNLTSTSVSVANLASVSSATKLSVTNAASTSTATVFNNRPSFTDGFNIGRSNLNYVTNQNTNTNKGAVDPVDGQIKQYYIPIPNPGNQRKDASENNLSNPSIQNLRSMFLKNISNNAPESSNPQSKTLPPVEVQHNNNTLPKTLILQKTTNNQKNNLYTIPQHSNGALPQTTKNITPNEQKKTFSNAVLPQTISLPATSQLLLISQQSSSSVSAKPIVISQTNDPNQISAAQLHQLPSGTVILVEEGPPSTNNQQQKVQDKTTVMNNGKTLSTTVSRNKNNQKENVRIPKMTAHKKHVVHSKASVNQPGTSKNGLDVLPNRHTVPIKRKVVKAPNEEAKRLRLNDNLSTSAAPMNNLEDDDVVILDTSVSSAGSLSTEVIKNLGSSGINKVMTELNKNKSENRNVHKCVRHVDHYLYPNEVWDHSYSRDY